MTADREHVITFHGNVATHPGTCWCMDEDRPKVDLSARLAAAAFRNRMLQRQDQPEAEDGPRERRDTDG